MAKDKLWRIEARLVTYARGPKKPDQTKALDVLTVEGKYIDRETCPHGWSACDVNTQVYVRVSRARREDIGADRWRGAYPWLLENAGDEPEKPVEQFFPKPKGEEKADE